MEEKGREGQGEKKQSEVEVEVDYFSIQSNLVLLSFFFPYVCCGASVVLSTGRLRTYSYLPSQKVPSRPSIESGPHENTEVRRGTLAME